MKMIVDFDDVLFDVSKLKERFFKVLKRHGVKNGEDEYTFERKNDRPFSLRLFLERICKEESLSETRVESMYQDIMSVCKDLKNIELLELLRKNGRENCFVVTTGDKEFQMDKIIRTEIDAIAHEVIIVPGSKKAAVESLCLRFPNDRVVFIDDKIKFFDDITMEKCPNLQTILFDKFGLLSVKEAMEEAETK